MPGEWVPSSRHDTGSPMHTSPTHDRPPSMLQKVRRYSDGASATTDGRPIWRDENFAQSHHACTRARVAGMSLVGGAPRAPELTSTRTPRHCACRRFCLASCRRRPVDSDPPPYPQSPGNEGLGGSDDTKFVKGFDLKFRLKSFRILCRRNSSTWGCCP